MNHLIEQGESLFNELSEQSIAMQLVGDNVKVYARQNTISESLLLKIRQNKEQLKEFLKSKKKLPQIKPDKEALYQPFPLTDIQRAYWVGHQMEVELADVSIHYYSEVLCASLDLVRFDEAVQKTIARHDMLRAVVDEQGSQQILANTPAYEVQFDDIRHLDDAQKTTWLGEYRNARSHSQRSPGHFPGFDFSIVRVSDAQDILYASVDLLHVDGGSLMILFNDLYRFYEDASYNPEPISISYRDYALAEASIHHSTLYQQGLEYWRNEVKNLPAAPDLPQLNVASQASRFVRHQFNITPEQGAMLKRRAADLKVTPTVFVMLAFSELLRKWNSGNDFTLNVTVFNRLAMHPDVNQLIGDFTSMLLIPVSHDQDETLADKVLRLQKKLWSSMKHRHVSGVTVLNELGKYTGNQGNVQMPIVFTSMLDLGGQGIPSNWLSCFGEEQFTLTQTPQVSFDHQITQLESGEMRFSWDVIEHLFPLGMVEDMFEVYEQLVLALIEDPASWKQNSLDILPQRQLEVVAQANDSQVDFGEPCSLLDLFKTSVAAQPDATAVVSGDTHFSYAQLDLQARQLAAKIIEHNIAPGSVIAIFMEKGWEQVVAALAIHYSGCAYLPLDVEQPVQRLSYQLENSAAVAILHQDHLLSQAQTLPVAHAIAVTLQEQTECVPDEQVLLQRKPAPGDLSHLIYTSGSTGKPKGVMVEHQQVVNRMLDINQRFAIGAGDAVIALTALHHDLSVYDLFGMLAAGGTMVIPQRDLRLDPQHWLALASRHQVTVWNSVPAYLDIFLDYLDTQSQAMSADAFKMFILAGDWIPVNQPKRVHGYWPQAQFVASGGPTETTIWDIYNLVDPNETFKESIPYGRPLANSQYKILDRHMNPCPTWVAGEMYISGAGVTAGYMNQPQLTAERYVKLPTEDTVYFKSGDMGRYLPNGQIEFVGRNDHQVKIRGLRIELPEIEAVAESLPEVSRAVALVKQTDQGPKLRLWVQAGCVMAESVSTPIDFDGQESDFESSDMSVADVSERLTRKLEYRAQQVADESALHTLPDIQHEQLNQLKSYREFASQTMSLDAFSRCLALLRARTSGGEMKSGYGSAGGLFPVQIYFHLKENCVESLQAGLYRYYPLQHAMAYVNATQADPEQHFNHNRVTCENAPIAMYFVLHEPTIVPQYGQFSESMGHIEVGMIAQLLRSEGPKIDLGICQIGGLKDQARLEQDLGLTSDHTYLGSLLMGQIDHHAKEAEMLSQSEITARVREQLSASLPNYMVPDEIGVLPELPLTANGKVDRKALLTKEVAAQSSMEISQPTNELEAILCDTFKSIVGAEQVSTTERFFDMGANSALLVQVYHAFRKQVDIEFKLIEMFKHPTVSGLIASIAQPTTLQADTASSEAELERLRRKRTTLRNRLKKG